ncbi:MAG: AAA family ATPase [Halieaceae bacterium]|jgi:predicted ATPase|nr:AAA family ATPase [Halieaceae bacterium]
MHVETLQLTNMRAIETAELRFSPGFNLLVGVNGVGKTTVLDALAYCLSGAVREVNALRSAQREPTGQDIRVGAAALTLECDMVIDGKTYAYLVHQPRSDAAVAHSGEGKPREQVHELEPKREFLRESPPQASDKAPSGRPLAVLFSTRRAAAGRSETKQRRASGGWAAGFAGALSDRELALTELAEWIRVQQTLQAERTESAQVLEAFEAVTRRFLPGYQNLRVSDSAFSSAFSDEFGGHRLLIDHGQTETVRVDSGALSDTESAQLQHAIKWTEDWLALNWTADGPEGSSPNAADEARKQARKQKLEEAIERFLPTCRRLRPDQDGNPDALIDLLPTTLLVEQLSDGERGALSLVLDLTRRLAQANPHLADPAAEAEAVVLVDEIDLHLHPRWQREVIHNLTAAFPKCQFIATTHSPQVISEVPHDRVQIITPEGVYSPDHSYGIDASRVLEELMDARARPKAIEEKLNEIAQLSRPETIGQARDALGELAEQLELGENDPEITRLRTLLDFMEGEP